MISRRGVLQGLGAGSASALMLSFNGLAAAATGNAGCANMLLIYDSGLMDAPAFVSVSAGSGHHPQPISGDFATMLYRMFPLEAVDSPKVLLGLTSYADYVVAAGIGREQGVQLAGALLREQSGVRLLGGSTSGLARHVDGTGYETFLGPSEGTQTNVLWALV